MAVPYREILRDAFRLTEADVCSALPLIQLRIEEIDLQALEVWRQSWTGLHPSGFGAFDWAKLHFRFRSPRDFQASLWSEGILCGLAIGSVPRNHSRFTLHCMARKQNAPNPLRGLVTGIVAAAAEYYSRGLGTPLMEIENPAPGLIGRYRAHGFTLAYERGSARYLAKKLD